MLAKNSKFPGTVLAEAKTVGTRPKTIFRIGQLVGNQLPRLPGSASKVSVVVWANPLLCHSQLDLRLSWAVRLF